MTRGPDGRYGCQSPADARAPVAVTCDGCGRSVQPGEPIWVNRERFIFIGDGRVTRPLPVGPWCAQCEGAAPARPWMNAGHWGPQGWVQDPPRACRNCGRLFHAAASAYCSDRCANIQRAARRRQAREQARSRCCCHCGDLFSASRSDARYCSPGCRQRAYRERIASEAAERERGRAILAGYNTRLLGSCS